MSVLFDPHENLRRPKDRWAKRPDASATNTRKNKYDDLQVFGYSSTLYDEVEKALHYDSGKHLIPWMGDKTLLIDRYDARLYFTEQSQFVYDEKDKNSTLSPEEAEIERQCDEERYLALNTDLQEQEELEDEEMKRFKQAISDPRSAVPYTYQDSTTDQYNAAYSAPYYHQEGGYSYDTQSQEQQDGAEHSAEEQNGTAEVKEEEEEPFVPSEVLQIPAGMAIPDTAKQNSIVERTALFVSKHGVQMEIVLKAKQAGNPQFDFLTFDNWLNPYYKHILKIIKNGIYFPTPPPGVSEPATQETKQEEPEEDSDEDSDDEGYELHPLLAASLHKKIPKTTKPEDIAKSSAMHSTVPDSWATVNTYDVPSYSMVHDLASFGPFTEVSVPSYHGSLSISTVANLLPPPPPPPGEGPEEDTSNHPRNPLPPPPIPPVPPIMFSPRMSHGLQPTPVEQVPPQPAPIIPPPPDLQPIVDKLAHYVAKNGDEFEKIVRAKQDPRFDFLNVWSSHYTYYEHKKKLIRGEMSKTSRRRRTFTDKAVTDDGSKNKPISFSIKAKDGTKPKIEYRSNVIYKIHEQEESEEEEEEAPSETNQNEQESTTPTNDQALVEEKPVVNNTVEELRQTLEDQEDSWTKVLRERERIRREKEEAERLEQEEAEAKRVRQEMMQLEKMVQEEEEMKAKEKQIQIERRRRAAAFISMLRNTNSTTDNPSEETQSKEPRKRTFQEVKNKSKETEVGAPSPDKIKVTEDLMAKVLAAQKNR